MSVVPHIGPYAILRRLGEGEVYLARDPRLERDVVLKVLRRDLDVARLRRETLGIASISHPNIVTIYGLEEFAGQVVLVLEHVEGATTLRAQGAVPTTEFLRVALRVCEALEAAHRKSIAHGRISVEDVLIGPGGIVKVMNFGFGPGDMADDVRALGNFLPPGYLRDCLGDGPPRIETVRICIEETLGIRRAAAFRAGELATTPNSLPQRGTSFVGRERPLAHCLELLAGTRLLTLTGVGGAGKTRLAIELARRRLGDFEGVWFVDLASLADPERVPQALALAAGVAENVGQPMLETLVAHLAQKKVLLVLDNCEHLLEACAALVTRVLEGTSDVRILATSREGLGVRGEQVYSAPSFSLPREDEAPEQSEAIRLFVERARLIVPEFALTTENTPLAVEICRRLDGIPLAIELAAARVRVLGLEEIRDRLHDRFRLLTGGSRTAIARHQTLRAAMQWSYDLLEPAEQKILRTLSVFAGGWTLEGSAIAAPPGMDSLAMLAELGRLEDKSLLVVDRPDYGENRYHLLETVRQYARDLLIAAGESDVARTWHMEWYLRFAEHAFKQMTGPHQAVWLDRETRELDNLRAALDWCMDRDIDSAVRMGAALQWLYVLRGHIHEGRERLTAIAARAHEATENGALAGLLQGAGNMEFRLDRLDRAKELYERALALREKLDDEPGMAGSLGALGNIAQYEGRFADAIALFERSLEINRRTGNKGWEGANLVCLGNCGRYTGQLERAAGYFEQALALNREIGNRSGEGFALDALGCVKLELNDLAGARPYLEQALAIERELGDEHEEAVTLLSLGGLATEEGGFAEARARFAEAIPMLRRLSAGRQMASALDGLATLSLREGDAPRAVRLRAAADTVRDSAHVLFQETEGRLDILPVLKSMLAQDEFDAAWQEGTKLTLDQAIALGLPG